MKSQKSLNLTKERIRKDRSRTDTSAFRDGSLRLCYIGTWALFWEVQSYLEAVQRVVLRRR